VGTDSPTASRQAAQDRGTHRGTSILYSTLMLFAVSGLLALLVLAAIIWWVVRRGKRA
jgi:hypothetical protein